MTDDPLNRLIAAAGDRPTALLAIARTLLAKGKAAPARELAARAMALAPADAEILALGAEIMNAGIHDWHFSIVRDEIRNAAYDAALRRAMRPGMRVLDIGSGTGLLALMAARAGAAEVITCEMNPAIAEAARKVIAANGYGDRIRVIAKHSADLDVTKDLGGPVDLLVSEIVSNDMLSEAALPAHEQAVRRLLKPGARIIPARGTVRAALAASRKWPERMMGEASGFDLSPFNALQPRRLHMGVGDERIGLKSDAIDLMDFDFQSGGPFPEGRTQKSLWAEADGANGIIQWIRLEMDEEGVYENQPKVGRLSCWAAQFYPFPAGIQVAAGAQVTVHCAHDRLTLRIWADRE